MVENGATLQQINGLKRVLRSNLLISRKGGVFLIYTCKNYVLRQQYSAQIFQYLCIGNLKSNIIPVNYLNNTS